MTFAFACTIAPWTVVCIYRHGSLNNFNHVNIAFALEDTMDNWNAFEAIKARYPSALSVVRAHPQRLLRHTLANLAEVRTLVYDQMPLAAWLALVGMVSTWRGWNLRRPPESKQSDLVTFAGPGRQAHWDARHTVFVTAVAAWALGASLAWWEDRFLMVVLAGTSLFAAAGVCRGLRWAGTVPLVRIGIAAMAVYSAASVSCEQFPTAWQRLQPNEEQRAGWLLAQRTPRDAKVLTSSGIVTYYAERSRLPMSVLGDATAHELSERVYRMGATHLVYSERHSTKEAPQLRFLLDPTDPQVPSEFELIYRLGSPWPIVVYAVGEQTSTDARN